MGVPAFTGLCLMMPSGHSDEAGDEWRLGESAS